MKVSDLTQVERGTYTGVYGILCRVFRQSEPTEYSEQRTESETVVELPLDRDCNVLAPNAEAVVRVRIQRIGSEDLSIKIINGRDNLPGKRLALPFIIAARKVNKQLSDDEFRADQEFQSVGIERLDRMPASDPSRIFKRRHTQE